MVKVSLQSSLPKFHASPRQFVKDVFSTHPNQAIYAETARIATAAGVLSGMFGLMGIINLGLAEKDSIKQSGYLWPFRLKGFGHFNLSLLSAIASRANIREWQQMRKPFNN